MEALLPSSMQLSKTGVALTVLMAQLTILEIVNAIVEKESKMLVPANQKSNALLAFTSIVRPVNVR